LETACSPRSTLLFRVSERNRTRCLDVHRVACHPATPQTPSTSLLKKVSGTLKACEKTGALFCPQGSRHLFQQAVVPAGFQPAPFPMSQGCLPAERRD